MNLGSGLRGQSGEIDIKTYSQEVSLRWADIKRRDNYCHVHEICTLELIACDFIWGRAESILPLWVHFQYPTGSSKHHLNFDNLTSSFKLSYWLLILARSAILYQSCTNLAWLEAIWTHGNCLCAICVSKTLCLCFAWLTDERALPLRMLTHSVL